MRPLQRAQPVVDEKKRNENRRDADGHEPFIANMTGRMKREALGRKLVVKLPDERLQRRALKPQTELGDAALEEILDRSVTPNRQLPSRAQYHREKRCHARTRNRHSR